MATSATYISMANIERSDRNTTRLPSGLSAGDTFMSPPPVSRVISVRPKAVGGRVVSMYGAKAMRVDSCHASVKAFLSRLSADCIASSMLPTREAP